MTPRDEQYPLSERVAKLENNMSRVLGILDGRGAGEPGLLQRFNTFVDRWEEREKGKMEYDDRIERRQKRQIALISLLVVSVGVLIGYLTYKLDLQHSSLLQPEHSETYSLLDSQPWR